MVPQRGFFGRKNTSSSSSAEEKKKEESKAAEQAAADKDKETKSTSTEATADKGQDQDSKKEESKEESAKSSSEENAASDEEEGTLSAKDVKRIKQLFNEQETEIKSLEKQIEKLEKKYKKLDEESKADSKRKENEIKLARIEYTKQVKENESTVQRYRKMIEDEKEFAITKFAKDLLEVRDAVRMALEHTDMEALLAEEDAQVVKDKFVANMEGSKMTADVMDKCLERFKVTQYDPKGQKFDP